MQTKIIISIGLLLFFSTRIMACDCLVLKPFTINYLDNYNKNDTYFIKGIKLKKEYHGVQIKILEDIKGNLQEDTIMVWGDNGNLCRIDNLDMYNDTLCMLITKTDMLGNVLNPNENDLEKIDDYMLITCSYSVVKYSNGFIMGKINTHEADTSLLLTNFLNQIPNKLIDIEIENEVYLYPNPVNHQLTIHLNENITLPLQMEIYNDSGLLILCQNYFKHEFSVNVDSLNSGMYIIKITDKNNSNLTNKFVKL